MLLSDTAELCTGFPLLRSDPIFLSALLDLFQTRKLTSVCIGVHGESQASKDLDFALQARADYRISLLHYPRTYELTQQIAQKASDSSGAVNGELYQQAVSLIIDNVTGKHYDRTPRWLWVIEPDVAGLPKVLNCGASPSTCVSGWGA